MLFASSQANTTALACLQGQVYNVTQQACEPACGSPEQAPSHRMPLCCVCQDLHFSELAAVTSSRPCCTGLYFSTLGSCKPC